MDCAFPHKLIWVRHDDADPCEMVCDALIDRFQDCHVVRGMGADQFFTELANILKLPQPEFLIDPFAHMLGVLEEIRPYKTLDERGVDLIEQGREMLRQAASTQQLTAPDQSEVARLMGEERYADVWAQFGAGASERNEAERDLIAWAAIMDANGLSDQAKQKRGAEADASFAEAGEKYAAALAIKPDKHEALNNWGVALSDQAKQKQGAEADAPFAKAQEILLRVEAIMAGSGSYNLACIEAQRGNIAAAILGKGKYPDFPDCAHIAADPDFDRIRDEPEFRKVLAELGC